MPDYHTGSGQVAGWRCYCKESRFFCKAKNQRIGLRKKKSCYQRWLLLHTNSSFLMGSTFSPNGFIFQFLYQVEHFIMSINITISAYFSYSRLARLQIRWQTFRLTSIQGRKILCLRKWEGNGVFVDISINYGQISSFEEEREDSFSGEKASTPGSLI